MPRIHDLATLRENIKLNATRARELRQEARETFGEDRWYLKADANEYGELTRHPHLAVGYLRGRTIDQMESDTTHPLNLPDAELILHHAREAFLEGPDAPEWPREKRTETRKVVPKADDRGFLAKLVGVPAPEPDIQVQSHIDELDPPGWDEFAEKVRADIKAWHARCLANHHMKVARRAAARKEVA